MKLSNFRFYSNWEEGYRDWYQLILLGSNPQEQEESEISTQARKELVQMTGEAF